MRNVKILTVRLRLALTGAVMALVVLLGGTRSPLPVVSGQNPQPDPSGPAALIDKIVVGGSSQTTASVNVTVKRAGDGEILNGITGLMLYRGDAIEVAKDTQVTVLFLDPPVAEKHDQIIIDGGVEGAKVGISSNDTWWGRTWAKVKGIFTSRTTYVQVGAHGTEYELDVSKDGRQTSLVMLEGDFLEVTRGTFSLVGRLSEPLPGSSQPVNGNLQFVAASFGRESVGQTQPGRSLDAVSGQVSTFEVTYNIFNECHQRHRFEFRTSDDTPWLKLNLQKTWQIAGQQRQQVPATLTIDARRLSQGPLRGHVYLVCLDCNQEAQCPGSQVDWPYSVNVTGTGPIVTPTPTPTQTATPQTSGPTSFRLTELQQAIIPNSPAPATPQRADESRVRSVLDWTNAVILTTQPSYSAEGLITHFNSREERSRNFRTAREQAILRNEPGSNKIVGDVYSDWGQPALAAGAYDKERTNVAGPQTPANRFAVDRAEAYRLTGKIEQARELALAGANSRSPAAQNLLGNIYHDYAVIDIDRKDWGQAKAHLDQAENFYRSALPQGQRPAAGDAAIRANLAKAQVFQGDVILEEARRSAPGSQGAPPQTNAAQLARIKYTSAVQVLGSAAPAESTYPFEVQSLGRAYQGLGDAAMLAGEPAAAADSYANAKSHYQRIIQAHPDCAEAYYRLGDLYEDLGDKENARLNYSRAIQTRPDQSASYYPLALLIQNENPRLAQALAATYLKLQPEVFKQGDKARNAERIARGGTVTPDRRIGETKVSNSGPSVPSVLSKPLSQATRELEAAGYRQGNVIRRADASQEGTVLSQSPAAGSSAARNAPIDLVVSSGPASVNPVVPDVRGRSLADARIAIENANLRVGKVEQKLDNSKPQGVIDRQNPGGGKNAVPGSFVDLVVIGSKPVDVPDIMNDKEETARKKILDRKLTVGDVTYRPSCDAVGKVVAQDQRRKVEPGTAISFVVGSVGEDPVIVPQFVGGNRREVESAIRERRFILSKVKEDETDDARPGTVRDQSPPEGTRYARDCPVKIEITVAVPLTIVGNYVGLSEREARQQVSNGGLSPIVRNQEMQDRYGTVIDQNPPAGTRVKRRHGVTLVVSVPVVQTISVPDVVGRSLIDARNIIQGASLTLGRITYVDPQFAPRTVGVRQFAGCTVTRQDPIKGQPVRASTGVNLWVVRMRDANGRQLDCLNSSQVGDH
jgi:beta-lactam-binding protein with PASTA domain/tetratricopeptide (TPR) repeat protein